MSSKTTNATKEQIKTIVGQAADSLWDLMMSDAWGQVPEAARPMVEVAIQQLTDAIQIVRK